MNLHEREFTDLETAAQVLAEDLAAAMRDAIAARDQAVIAVSGGRTPKQVFEHLRQSELDWRRVTLTLIDERWVPPDHPESNERLVRSYLLQGPAAAATFVPLYNGADSPESGQAGCEAAVQKLAMPFDAVYLGMGSDGHFASLFPGDPAVETRDGLCVAVPGTESRLPRMSLTAPVILDARKIFLLFSGEEKLQKYREAQKPGPYRDIPLRLVLHQERTPVEVLFAV